MTKDIADLFRIRRISKWRLNAISALSIDMYDNCLHYYFKRLNINIIQLALLQRVVYLNFHCVP